MPGQYTGTAGALRYFLWAARPLSVAPSVSTVFPHIEDLFGPRALRKINKQT